MTVNMRLGKIALDLLLTAALTAAAMVDPPPTVPWALASVAPGESGAVMFASISTAADVILFGKEVPHMQHITDHYNLGPDCDHGGQKWSNISNYTTHTFLCAFEGAPAGPEGVPHAVPTRYSTVHSITMQTYRCYHPLEELRAEHTGRRVTLLIDGKLLPTEATYELPLPTPAAEATAVAPAGATAAKPYFLCSCMTMWYRTEFLLEWLRYHKLAHGVEKLFMYVMKCS
jgi:hypothetical protein